MQHPDNSTSGINYDGLITTTTNGLGQQHTEEKNALGELVSVTDNLSNTTTYTYNTTGKLSSLTDSLDNTISTISYDSLGRKISMDDADKGAWSYSYNAAGALVSQTDAKAQVTDNYYDKMGRLVNREEYNASSVLTANAVWDYSSTTGLMTQEEDTLSGFKIVYGYDNSGRLDLKTTTIDGTVYTEDKTYDEYGRTFQEFDVSGKGVQYEYTTNGYLKKIMDVNNITRVYKEITSMGPYGNVTGEILENGADTTRVYNAQTGRLESIATSSNNILIQNLEYDWDVAGNLIERRDTGWMSQTSWKDLTELFYYDGLNRLTSNTINGVTEMSLSYNAIGNITSKTGIDSTKNFGTYTYGATCGGVQAGPHAVTSAGSRSYCYDLNGNMLSGDGRTLAYTTFDKPSAITKSGHTTSFAYGTNHNRYKRVDTEGSLVITKHYVGNVEIITNSGTGKTSYKRYIGGSTIKTQVVNGGTTTEYVHQDHLGSLDAITRADGTLKADVSFDAFGVRRNAVAWPALGLVPSADLELITDTTDRGFTNHEMLDDVGVIHMNGRIYDGRLGRFMQADSQIQEPNNSQSLNRYSYVINNPLSYTDPTGYNFLKKYWRAIVAIVATYITAGYASGWAISWGMGTAATATTAATLTTAGAITAGAIAGAVGGFVAGALQSGSLNGALKGAFSGAIAGAAGGYANFGSVGGWDDAAARVGVAALGGCGAGKASGGSCSKGARLAGMMQSLSVGMEMYSKYKPTWARPTEGAKVKLEGTGVYNSNSTNVGVSIEVPKIRPEGMSNAQYTKLRNLVGTNLDELSMLQRSNLSGLAINSGKFTDTLQFGMTTEAKLGGFGTIPGFNSMAVFHDVWMAKGNVQSAFMLGVTVVPAMYINYQALGVGYYGNLYDNLSN